MVRVLLSLAVSLAAAAQVRTAFRVKYVAEGAVYLDGGRASGLAEHMKLAIRGADAADVLAELEIVAVAESSAVCEIRSAKRPLRPGDVAHLSAEDVQNVELFRARAVAGGYAQVVTFTEGDPLDEEARERLPHPPLPEVNRVRGRIGFEYNSISDARLHSSQGGFVFRADITRIGGSYWNLSGYTRTRLNRRSGANADTLSDLVNRTYHLTLSYQNPGSRWSAGLGRFYLPWAASLNTIDGGYIARRYGRHVTVGTFAGSTPDPTSWNYNPNRQLLGAFVNYEGGSFETVRYSSTTGAAVSRIRWRPERQFAFFENTLVFQRRFSIYHNLEADKLSRERRGSGSALAATRSFVTLRYEPRRGIALDLNHNYFRDFPTFDPRLIGLGLVDKLLFQGVSGGARIDLPHGLGVYTNLGRSSRTGDARSSWNQMYGVSKSDILGTGVRADARYSRFHSSFGSGNYESLTLSKDLREALRVEVQAGRQIFSSALTAQNRARYVNGNLDWFVLSHYFLGGGVTVYRGQTQNYDQVYVNLGYRF